ncbi:MAG: phytanoyl-CoA dioxygenase family protein [Planctomycetota bacterium]|nr:phytanoyl-CoA dioxygenase family protein [Planctomycetota bacterium]
MNPQNLKAAFDRDGFVIVHQFLPGDELLELKTNLDRYILDVVPTLPDSSAFYQEAGRLETLKQMQHMGVDPFFEAYPKRSRWTELAASLVGEEVEGQEPEWFNKPPRTEHVTPPHQDNFYFCLKPPNVLTLWLALDPVDEENGCLRYVRGSHLGGIRPHSPTEVLGFSQSVSNYSPDDEALEQPIFLKPGDLVVHHGETVHRADPNRSVTRHRRAFAMVYRGTSCCRDEAAFQRYQEAVKRQHELKGLKVSD